MVGGRNAFLDGVHYIGRIHTHNIIIFKAVSIPVVIEMHYMFCTCGLYKCYIHTAHVQCHVVSELIPVAIEMQRLCASHT